MNSKDYRNIREAYLQVYNPQELTEEQVWEEVENWVNSLLEEGYDLSDYTWDELYESYFDEAQYTPPPQIQQPPAEVRNAPKNKLSPVSTVGTGLAAAYLGNEIGKKLLKKKPNVKGVFEELDIFGIVLEYLITEGYADTQVAALAIMGNMSEEWKDTIVEEVLDEAYVDYRKGKLPSGRTPQQSLGQRRTRNQSRADITTNYDLLTPRNPVATKFREREVQARQVGKEMDAHTSFGGKINKALSPGLGNRSGAAPRVAYGEPNTDRHQSARNRRGQSSTKD